MKKFFVFTFLAFLSINLYAQFSPKNLKWKYLDNMPLSEYDGWAGNRTTCSIELRKAISGSTDDKFDIVEFFQIKNIYKNETKDDDEFWEYIFNNYEEIIDAILSPGDVNIFFAPTRYFKKEDITSGYFLVSRYNGGEKNDPGSYRLYLYYYQLQWM